MNTTRQPETALREPARGKSGVRAATLDLLLLIGTILVLAGAAAGIVIGCPQALEIVATQANASVIVS